jgi:hypothetical protein
VPERGGSSATPTRPAAEKEPEAMQLPFRDLAAEVNIRRLYLREIEVADWQTTVKLEGSRVRLNPCKLRLNGAPAELTADLDLGVPGYKYELACNAQHIPLAPLMNSFQPERKGQVSGTVTGQARAGGAGVTGLSLQKNLAAQFDVSSTNLNLSVKDIRNPLLKGLVSVVSWIPELVGNPAGAAGLLLQTFSGKTQTSGTVATEVQKSPIDSILARGKVGSGRVDLQHAVVQSPTFRAEAQGTIALAPIWTNSPIQIPVAVSLNRSLAQRMNLVPANTPTNAAYARLPDFLTMKGTVGAPVIDMTKLASGLLQGVQTAVPSASGVLQQLGTILTGSTNAPTGGRANQPGANQNTINDLLQNFLGPSKQ